MRVQPLYRVLASVVGRSSAGVRRGQTRSLGAIRPGLRSSSAAMLLGLLLIGCGESTGVQPPPPPPPPGPAPSPVQGVTNLAVEDASNTGTAADIRISFNLSNSAGISALRVFIVDEAQAASFDTAAARAVAAGRFQDLPPISDQLFLDGQILTAGGSPLVEGSIYRVFVLSLAVGDNRTDTLVRDGQTLALATTDLVLTLFDNLQAGNGGVTVGPDGMIYVGDSGPLPNLGGSTIFRFDSTGTSSEVFASGGSLNTPLGGAFDSNGLLHWASFGASTVHRISAAGIVSTFVTDGISSPVGIAFDANDTLFVANCGSGSIQKVAPDGVSTQLAASPLLNCPNGIVVGPDNDVYVVNFNDSNVLRVTRAGVVSVLATLPGGNNGHISYRNGLFYVAARGAHRIYTVNMSGTSTPIAGSGIQGIEDGASTNASLSLPNGVAFNADGTRLYFNQVRSTSGSANAPTQVRFISFEQP